MHSGVFHIDGCSTLLHQYVICEDIMRPDYSYYVGRLMYLKSGFSLLA